jgi:methionyl-tRNA formyltransferase
MTETGVTVIRMTPKIDAGGMMAFASTPIGPDETAGEVEDRLATIGAPLIARAIAELVAGTVEILPQDRSKVTKAPKLTKEDGRIDWTRSNQEIHNLVRAMQPWPIASTYWLRPENPLRLIVHQTKPVEGEGKPGQVLESQGDRLVVAAGTGAVQLLQVQLEGKKVTTAADFLRGYQLHNAQFGNLA